MRFFLRSNRTEDRERRAGAVLGDELARRVAAEYGTRDVFALARLAGVKLVWRRWPLVTVGECDPRTKTISVNLAALARAQAGEVWLSRQSLARVIIAHELGHFFAARPGQAPGGKGEGRAVGEAVAHSFAATLLQLPFPVHRYERLWRGE